MEVLVGGASGVKGHPEPGDQNGDEVRIQKFATVATFANGWMSYYSAYRPVNSAIGSNMARIMEIACNNPNIGYLNRYPERLEIFQYGENSSTPCRCDCSSLVGYCIAAATGDKSIGTDLNSMAALMLSSGLFTYLGPVSSYSDTNPPCAGDVLITGHDHTEMVVAGGTSSGYVLGRNSNFTPRTKAPSPSEPAYALYYAIQYCENANASYAWSRFSEILEALCKLSRSTGRHWYNNAEDGYKRGTFPSPGAIMCYTNTENSSDPGFVCIVEGGSDTEVYVSYVSLSSGSFEYSKIKKHDGVWDLDLNGDGKYEYFFQGFIYNPNVKVGYNTTSKLTEFIEMAKSHITDGRQFTRQYSSVDPDNAPWSAAFVMAVAKAVGGVLGVVIPNTNSCSSIGSLGTEGGMGNWLNGPLNNGNPYPKAGDIALFRLNATKSASKYDADKAAIITYVDTKGSTAKGGSDSSSVGFTYVMGDSSGQTESKSATSATPSLVGIFRPNWIKIDSYSGAAGQNYTMGYLAQGASIEDAILKDYKYINAYKAGSEPSINSDGIMLCAVNYSGMLGSVYTIFANMIAQDAFISTSFSPTLSNISFDLLDPEVAAAIDGLTGSIDMGNGTCYLDDSKKTIYKFLYMLFSNNPGGAIGFMANMWAESGFNTAAVNSSSNASGLCQWLGGRRERMVTACGGEFSWKNNLSGQLNFLKSELEGSYRGTLTACAGVTWNMAGAMSAANYVCRHFEVPVVDNEPKMKEVCLVREGYAQRLWLLFFGGAETVS